MDPLSPSEALSRLKELVRHGKLGKNYTFKPTEKNKLLLETYYLDDSKKKDILLSIEDSDYSKDEYSNDPDNPVYYIYAYIMRQVLLMPKFSTEIQCTPVDIYVKFYFSNDSSSVAVIMSFHKNKDY